MTRHTKRTDNPTVRTRQNLLATVIVLALVGAFALIEIILAHGGVVGPAADSTPPLPPAKATIFARSQQAIATARAGTPAPKLPYAPPAAQPTATLTTGIFQEQEGPFSNSDFSIHDEYQGPVDGHWVVIYAGTAWTNFPTTGVGALRVYTVGVRFVGVFDAPDGSGDLNITGVSGTTLQIVSDKGTHLTFDMATDTFGS